VTDEEIDQELAAITAMQAAPFECRRERASQRAKQQRELLKEWNGSRVLGINGTENRVKVT